MQEAARPAPTVRRTVHLALRWVVGLILIATSVGKALDLAGFHDVLETYKLAPVWSLWLIAVAMPLIEAFIAVAMLTGWRLRLGILASALLHGGFAAILVLELLRGLDLPNCGCFGVFWARPLTWSTPLEDVAMLAITLGVWRTMRDV